MIYRFTDTYMYMYMTRCGVEIMQLRAHGKQLVADKSALQESLREKEALHEEMLQVEG